MFGEVINNVFGYDSKIWATLNHLFVPGRLAHLYQEGKRKSLLHPVRLFLFLFVVLAFIQSGELVEFNMAEAQGGRITLDYNNDVNSEIESVINAGVKWTKVYVIESLDSTCHVWIDKEKLKNFRNVNEAYDHYDLPNQWKYMLARKQIKFLKEPKAYEQFIAGSLIWIFLLLQPIVALVFKLVLPRYYFSDHLIWSLYLHSSMLTAVIIVGLITQLTQFLGIENVRIWLNILLFIGSVIFTYLSIRLYYLKGRFVSLLILLYLSIAYMLSITIAFIGNMLLSFLLF